MTDSAPTKGGRNPISTQLGIDTRNRIVDLLNEDVDNGGDGLTRAALAKAIGISKPTLHRHLIQLFEDGRVEQIGVNVLPAHTGHIHICRTCGKTLHEKGAK